MSAPSQEVHRTATGYTTHYLLDVANGITHEINKIRES
jgi:hypothetical protein